MLRRGFNGSRPRTCGLSITVGARAESAQASRRLFANAGAAPPSSGGGGGRAFGVLVGAAVGASAWTGYQYYTDPSFRSRLHDFWASLSSPTATTSKPAPPSPASPDHPLADTVGSAHAAEPALSGNGGAEAVPLLATQALLAPTDETGAQDVHEEAVVTMPDSLVAAAASEPAPEVEAGLSPLAGVPASPSEEEEKTEEEEEERAEQQAPVLAAPLVLVVVEEEEEEEEKEGKEVIPTKATDAQHSGARAEEATSATQPAAVPAAVVALVTESFAASDAHQEAIAAAAAHDVDDNVRAKDHGTPADTTPDDAHNQDKSEEEPKQREQHVTDGPTRLQELQAIKEIIAIQAESCERQVREKVERLRQKYEQKLAVLRQNMEEVVAEQVDVERQKIHDDLQHRLDQQLDSLERQYSEERQRVYAEMEDLVAGLNARFVELVREEKQLLTEQLDESARSHAQTLAYLQTLVEDAQYRTEHLRQEREWWSWTERLTSAVRALESAALGPDGHLLPFQAELDIVRSLAATRPLYKAVGPHIEAQASRGVYSVGRLRERFEQVEKHVRVAALVPEGGGLLRHAVAPLLAATVSLNPYHTPTQQELLLNSARRHLQDDDLLTALVDMEQLTGLARELAHDWIEEARKRLVVEQAISVIAADLTTLKPPTDL